LLSWFIVVVVGAGALFGVSRAGVPVTVTVDGFTEAVRSARPDVGKLLVDLGVDLRPEDRVLPALDAPLVSGLVVAVERGRPALIYADGMALQVYSQAETVGELLSKAEIRLAAHDEVWMDGEQVFPDTPLPPRHGAVVPARFARGRAWVGREPAEVRVSVRRAVPLTVDDGSVPYTIFTTAPTIGEALLREQLTLYLGDRVQPSLGSRVHAGMRVMIERSTPVLVTADGRTVQTRTQGKTVGDTLADLGIVVAGSDRVTPDLAEPVLDNTQIQVVRVLETMLVEREPIPFESILVPDDELEIDRQRLDQQGENGEYRWRFRVVHEDGVEVSRTLTDDWVAAEPIARVVAYGRKIVSRELETPEGTLSYWRKVRMLATSYSASTAGVSPTSSYYGRTRLGWSMREGIVAVDPTVVSLGSQVYVPGYGIGDAADTGGSIRGRRIDLGYDDDNLVLWYRWVDVYLLDPPPPRWQIRWVLPNWPQER
jgi:uncharacterized protein YabE (DUF348 family)